MHRNPAFDCRRFCLPWVQLKICRIRQIRVFESWFSACTCAHAHAPRAWHRLQIMGRNIHSNTVWLKPTQGQKASYTSKSIFHRVKSSLSCTFVNHGLHKMCARLMLHDENLLVELVIPAQHNPSLRPLKCIPSELSIIDSLRELVILLQITIMT